MVKETTTPKEAGIYTTNNLGELVSQWSEKNNILDIKRDYSLDALLFILEFSNCLISADNTFEKDRINKAISNIQYELSYGHLIIRELDHVIKNEKNETDIISFKELQEQIKVSIKMLEENNRKLSDFLERIELLPEYRKDTKKYEKDILETLDILGSNKKEEKKKKKRRKKGGNYKVEKTYKYHKEIPEPNRHGFF